MLTEPKYDEDVVNLGYFKKIVADPEGNLENIYENVSKHYASKPQPPYHKGDTWIDGDIIYTCINDREIGIYQDSDWTTESGAREEAERKNKVFLRQPSNYSVGDMWILQSDTDHKAGKKGEMLISTAGRKVYDEGDWVNMLGYGTIRSINEVADNLNDAIERIGVTEDAIADGIIITFYQDTMPEAKHIGDLWYVTETVEEYIKGKLYRYNGTEWEILNDPEITKAFEEANEARIVADGKIQSFYTNTEPTENVGVGDLWIDLDDNNKLYRYNGTKWIAVYDTRIDNVVIELETVTERTVKIETDLGKITQEVKEVETTVKTVKTTAEDASTKADNAQTSANQAQDTANTANTNAENAQETANNANVEIIATKERVGSLEIDVDNITQSVSSVETRVETVEGTATKALSDASKAQTSATNAQTSADKAQSTANTATTKADNAQTSANNAQSTANTANTNAQNAQKTADSNTTSITTTNKKVAELETSVNGISASVSSHTETIEQVQEQTNLNTDEIAKLGSIETVEGESLTVDGSNNPAQLVVYGNTEQEVTELGTNYLDASKFTIGSSAITRLEEGWFNVNYTNTGSSTLYCNLPLPKKYNFLKENTNYTIMVEIRNVDTTNLGNVYLRVTGDVSIFTSNATVTQYQLAQGDNKYTFERTTKDDFSSYTNAYILGTFIAINQGETANFDFRISIYDESYIGDYIEFTPNSPSPDYPSDIRNMGDNVNLFDKTTVTEGYYLNSIGEIVANAGTCVSDFIPVREGSYYTYQGTNIVSGWASKIGLYNKNKTFITYLDISKHKPTIKIPEGICYIRITMEKAKLDVYKIQRGLIPTPYTPYNDKNINIKVENKNLFNIDNGFIFGIGNDTTTINNDGTLSTTSNFSRFRNGGTPLYLKKNTNYVISLDIVSITTEGTKNGYIELGLYDETCTWIKNGGGIAILETNIGTRIKLSVNSGNYDKWALHISGWYGSGNSGTLVYKNVQVEEGTVATEYEPHQEQIISFPMTEGQLLHKGDYLAEGGIHQVRKTLVLDGTETIFNSGSNNATYHWTIRPSDKKAGQTNMLSNSFKVSTVSTEPETIVGNANNTNITFKMPLEYSTMEYFKTYLAEQYAKGTPVTVEYELAEEIIIPYTPEQQEVLNNIQTFKGINHIYCIDEIRPEKIVLQYYPNTPYNDTLVTKDTFDKVTTEMNAQINIKANEVETSVKESTTASILTLLNNGYLTAEQVNALVKGNAEDIATVKEQLTQTVTSSQMQIEITKAIEGGVSYLKNTLFTIDDNGMAIATSEDEFNALYNNKGMYLYSFDEMIAKFDVDGTTIEGNLMLEGEFITPNLRMMNEEINEEPHVYIHWIGG